MYSEVFEQGDGGAKRTNEEFASKFPALVRIMKEIRKTYLNAPNIDSGSAPRLTMPRRDDKLVEKITGDYLLSIFEEEFTKSGGVLKS